MSELPPFVLAERDALLEEIQAAFDGVGRQGGVSWSEAVVLDYYGTAEECAKARAKDQEARWQDLPENPAWDPETGVGGWSFLDAIGFRYYLPAAMVVALRRGWDDAITFHLLLRDDDLREWTQDKWTLLSLRQRLCVKRYLQYLGVVTAILRCGDNEHFEALDLYWGKLSVDSIDIDSTA